MIHAGPNPKPGSTNAYIDSVACGISEYGHDIVELHTAIRSNCFRRFHQKEFVKKSPSGRIISTIHWINSGVYAGPPPGSGSGTVAPDRDVEPTSKIRKAFQDLLTNYSPDIIHIQNLFGFPVALAREIKIRNIPYVLTLQDYTPICSTSHLFLPELRPCDLSREQLQCNKCCKSSKSYLQFSIEFFFNTLLHRVQKGGNYWKTIAGIRNHIVRLYSRYFNNKAELNEYQRRYDSMLDLLKYAARIHCLSNIQANRIRSATGEITNIRVIPVSPPAVIHPVPVLPQKNSHILSLCVLNVHQGRNDKGYSYLMSVLTELESRRKDFHVNWYAEGVTTQCIQFHGGYSLKQLDSIAAEADFSITPSLWLETQAYTGVEMLARGVPLICSNRAGVSEWVDDGSTGILFNPSTTRGLLEIIESLIDNRVRVKKMRDETMRRAHSIKTHQQHLREIESLYTELM